MQTKRLENLQLWKERGESQDSERFINDSVITALLIYLYHAIEDQAVKNTLLGAAIIIEEQREALENKQTKENYSTLISSLGFIQIYLKTPTFNNFPEIVTSALNTIGNLSFKLILSLEELEQLEDTNLENN